MSNNELLYLEQSWLQIHHKHRIIEDDVPAFLRQAYCRAVGSAEWDWIAEILDACESPIEQKFLACFVICSAKLGNEVLVTWPGEDCRHRRLFHRGMHTTEPQSTTIDVQWQIDESRVDFQIRRDWFDVAPSLGGKIVARASSLVECDGHDFHEKTKEQAKHDKQRDRTLQFKGHRILRFTGSEIFTEPFICAAEATVFLNELRVPFSTEGKDGATHS